MFNLRNRIINKKKGHIWSVEIIVARLTNFKIRRIFISLNIFELNSLIFFNRTDEYAEISCDNLDSVDSMSLPQNVIRTAANAQGYLSSVNYVTLKVNVVHCLNASIGKPRKERNKLKQTLILQKRCIVGSLTSIASIEEESINALLLI